MPESYQPGARKAVYGQNHRITENRYAWVTCEAGKFLILVGDDEGHGSDVVLYHPRPGKQPDVAIKLSSLTMPELEALREIFVTAFEWAKPVVERRDKEAEDAWNQGDDTHTRNYRPLPTVVYRKVPVTEHGQSIHERPERIPEGSRRERDGDSGGVRGAGDELAEPDSQQPVTQDDSTETN